MRWDELFRDLEAQLAAADTAALASEVADRTRREAAGLSLLDRAGGAIGHPVRADVLGGGPVGGVLLEVGAQWLLLRDAAGRDVLLPWSAVLSLTGLGVGSGVPGEGGEVFRRLGLGAALRAIARDRAPVGVGLVDGSAISGTLDRVGLDFVEISEHPVGEARRPAQVGAVRSVAFAGLASVTRTL